MTKHVSTGDIINALENAGGDITAAAALLGLRREAIYYRMNKNPDLFRIIERLRAERDAREKAEQEQTTGRPTAPEPLEAEAPSENTNAAESLPTGYTTADELLNHYRELTENARREIIPIAEGLKQEPEQIPEPTPQPTAGKLPSIADQINRQAARDLAATIRQYIQYNGLPREYAQVFDYLKYLDGKAAGET